MAYVQPCGTIQLFRGINLDNRYMHTIYFANETTQRAWFDTKAASGITIQGNTYTRPTRKSIKVGLNAETLIGISYLRFNNAGWDSNHTDGINTTQRTFKWYYAFVLSIDYVNENTSLITYEIDVMQTWFIQAGTINPCYILRNHIPRNDDVFGIHLEAEPVGSDVYDMHKIACKQMDDDFGEEDYAVITTSADPRNPPSGGDYTPIAFADMKVHGIFNGVWYYQQILNTGGMEDLYDALNNCLGSWDASERKADIISIIQFPGHFCRDSDETYSIKHPNIMDNYKPENKKLYGYPYSYLYITSKDGDGGEYRWEYFEGDVTDEEPIQFQLIANQMGMGAIALFPSSYNGIENNFDAKVTITNFPKCAFSYDSYQAWVASGGKTKTEYEANIAQQRGALVKDKIGVNAVIDVVGEGVSLAGNLATAANAESGADAAAAGARAGMDVMRMAGTIANAYMETKGVNISLDEAQHKRDFAFKDASYKPNTVVGSQVPTLAMGYNLLGFEFYNVHVRKEEMRKIDDFLTVYGYAINDVGVPNLNARAHWSFIQTRACNISGNMPASSREAIGRIFDGGIFFWRNGDEIGNFTAGSRNTYGAILNR